MHSTNTTSTTVAPKQCATQVAAVASTTTRAAAAETKPVNHNGPQCAECGWRGGNHAADHPSSFFLPQPELHVPYVALHAHPSPMLAILTIHPAG
ncbi:hypothetical protein C8R46DRAFT_1356328 [Mycena filopes]|nr:hypothetical protein C8R46DRAFT_1356328 [Mycena filopes]